MRLNRDTLGIYLEQARTLIGNEIAHKNHLIMLQEMSEYAIALQKELDGRRVENTENKRTRGEPTPANGRVVFLCQGFRIVQTGKTEFIPEEQLHDAMGNLTWLSVEKKRRRALLEHLFSWFARHPYPEGVDNWNGMDSQ